MIVPALDLLWQGPAGRVAANPAARPLRLGVLALRRAAPRGAGRGGGRHRVGRRVRAGRDDRRRVPRDRSSRPGSWPCGRTRRAAARPASSVPSPPSRWRSSRSTSSTTASSGADQDRRSRVDPPPRRHGRDDVAMRLGRTLCALAFLCAVLALDAAPAAAHGVGGLQPTNVRSRVLSIEPATPGVDVKVIENGRRLELTNASGATVVVSGYENEPYLRVGPGRRLREHPLPRRVPEPVAQRTGEDPRALRRVGGARVAQGERRRPRALARPPRALHGHGFVQGITVVGAAHRRRASRRRAGRPRLGRARSVVAVAGADARDRRRDRARGATGVAPDRVADPRAPRLGRAVARGRQLVRGRDDTRRSVRRAGAVVRRDRGRRPRARRACSRSDDESSAPFVLIAAVTFIVAGGIGDVASWFRSQLPSSLAAPAVRALVAFALGGGTGLVIASARRLAPRVRTTAAPEPVRQ